MKYIKLILGIILIFGGYYKAQKKECAKVTELSMIEYAEKQIKKNKLVGDTLICNIIVRWQAKDKKGLTSKIVTDEVVKENFTVLNIELDTIQLFNIKRRKVMLIFANNYGCLDCFNTINTIISKNEIDTSKVFIAIVGRVNNSPSAKKDLINSLKERMPLISKIYFDIHSEDDAFPPTNPMEGLFGKFNIKRTPAVLLWDNDTKNIKEFYQQTNLYDSTGIKLRYRRQK